MCGPPDRAGGANSFRRGGYNPFPPTGQEQSAVISNPTRRRGAISSRARRVTYSAQEQESPLVVQGLKGVEVIEEIANQHAHHLRGGQAMILGSAFQGVG